jgi:sugar phosphate isomerase/epimerase
VCLDTGHTALGHHWRRFVDVAGSRLVHVHASDNHGQYDDHLPPGEGRLEWSAIAQSLRDAAFTGWIMLELRCPEGDLGTYFQHARAQALRLLAP